MTQTKHETALPWWRVGMVWLVIAGPAAVVIAGIVTAFVAVSGADPQVKPASATNIAEVPALQGRNHAATSR
jgi:hypothetical protein